MTVSSGVNFDYSRGAALLKEVYADKLEDLVPETDKVAKMLPFVTAEKMPGNYYHQPVTMSRETGFTFNNDGGLFQLNKPIARNELDAKVQGTEFVLRSAMSYAMMQRALKGDVSTKAGQRAFVQTTLDSMKAIAKGASYAREAMLLYGGGSSASSELGIVATATPSSTTLTITMAAADWSTALWAGSEGIELDIYGGSTKRNASGTDSARTSKFVLTSVTPSTYTLVFTSHADNCSAVQAGDKLFFSGARTTGMLGLDGVCRTSGTLWNISTTSYTLWAPQAFNLNSSTLTFQKVLQGLDPVAALGFQGTMKVLVNPATWQSMAEDQAAMVEHADKRGGEVSMGFESIRYYGQTGSVVIEPHIYIKRGIALGIPEGEVVRVGSTDITFNMPGYEGKLVRELEDYAGIEIRTYYDQAVFTKRPAFLVRYYGISNPTD